MKVLTAHRCGAHHRLGTAFARCAFPYAAWISGTGSFAVIRLCGVVRLSLHHDKADAMRALEKVNKDKCGWRCVGHHELYRIDLGEVTS